MVKSPYQLYFICGSQDCPEGQFLPILQEALKAGITCFQFREKGPRATWGQAKIDLAQQAQALCQTYGIPFIVNDDLKLALLLGADGLHVGQSDGDLNRIRQAWPDKILGLSVSTQAEFDCSPLNVIDYIGVGPIFPTTSKSDAKPAVGLEQIRRFKDQAPDLPMVAIGGLTAQVAKEVRQAGADGLAVISAISRATDVENAVANLL